MKNNKRGFTLIELLVVIAIIALLSTLAVLALGASRASARDAKRIADLKTMQTAIELYGSNHGGEYPSAIDTWTELTTELGTYIQQSVLPTDPQLDKTNGYVYTYCAVDDNTPAAAHNKYLLSARLEVDDVQVEGDIDAAHAAFVATYDANTDCTQQDAEMIVAAYNAFTCADTVDSQVGYCLGAI